MGDKNYVFYGFSLKGQTANLPRGLTHAYFSFADIMGHLAELPRSLTYAEFLECCESVTGRLAQLPRGLRIANFPENKKITGQIRDLPWGSTPAKLKNAKITGNYADLPPNMDCFQTHSGIEGHIFIDSHVYFIKV